MIKTTGAIRIECIACNGNQIHTECGAATETEWFETEDGIEQDVAATISMFQCSKCQTVSLWLMHQNFHYEKLELIDDGWVPVHCLYIAAGIKQPFDFSSLAIAQPLAESLRLRWIDAEKCMQQQAWLAAIVFIGSILEGVLLAAVMKNAREACAATAAPKEKDKAGNMVVRKPQDWTLANMIDVACELGWINQSTQRFSNSLREFRNYIHPNEHSGERLDDVNKTTCEIGWKIVKDAIEQLAEKLRK